MVLIEGSLEVKLPGQLEKQRWEESGRRSQEVRIAEKRKSGKQEDAGAQKKEGKSRFTVFFK